MNKKNNVIRIAAAGMAFTMLASVPAMAAGPLVDNTAGNYDEATWARLQDNVLEYDEIPLLVHEYNTKLVDARETMAEAVKDLQDNVDELRSHQKKMEDLQDKAKRDGDVDSIKEYAASAIGLKMIANGMDGVRQELSGTRSTIRSMQKTEDQMADSARKLMIIYDSARRQKATLNQVVQAYDAQYELAVNKLAQDLGTETEVYAAQVNQLSAKSNLEALESSLLSLKPTLCFLTGWPEDGDPEIGEVPPLELTDLSEINLEDDTRKAIGNNPKLQEQRRSAEGKTNDGVARRLAAIEEGEQKLTIEMKRLYDDIFIKKTAYEAAQLGLQGAEKTRDYNERMFQQGMISKSQNLAMQIAYYQKKTAFDSADLGLRQAILTYNAAVRGTAGIID